MCLRSICSLDFMNDGFTVAAGTQSGKVLIYDLRALGSGGVPARSFEAHPGTHVSSVTFQLLPAKPAKSKPKVVGKENSKPSKASVSAANDPHPPSTAATGRPILPARAMREPFARAHTCLVPMRAVLHSSSLTKIAYGLCALVPASVD
jgi:hypothetical protein